MTLSPLLIGAQTTTRLEASVCPQWHFRLPVAYCKATMLVESTQESCFQKFPSSSPQTPKLPSLLSVIASKQDGRSTVPVTQMRVWCPPTQKGSTEDAKPLSLPWYEPSIKCAADIQSGWMQGKFRLGVHCHFNSKCLYFISKGDKPICFRMIFTPSTWKCFSFYWHHYCQLLSYKQGMKVNQSFDNFAHIFQLCLVLVLCVW